jgi:hypothetical protein
MNSRQEHQPTNDNADWEWEPEAVRQYIEANYRRLTPEDTFVSATAISALAEHATHLSLFNTLPFGTSICTGAVPRGSAIIEPLIRPAEQGSFIDVSDFKKSTTNETRRMMGRLARDELGIWTPHQANYAHNNERWGGSFQRAGKLARDHVHQQDMRQLESNAHHIVAVEYGPESATANNEEYQEFLRTICTSLKPEGILYMAYMLGSEGYDIGGVAKPAFPVTVDYVDETLHSNNMEVLVNVGTGPSNSIRTEGDQHMYDGIAVTVAVRN